MIIITNLTAMTLECGCQHDSLHHGAVTKKLI